LYDASMPEEDWGAQLAQGFEILLRAPLSTFDTDATWTMGGPDQLVPFDPDCVVEPKWERRLARVGHPVLRDHLRMLCLDARSARCAGAHYVRTRHRGFGGMRKAGGRVVAAWELGEGQAYSVVTALPRS
jgi:hypothetical protein